MVSCLGRVHETPSLEVLANPQGLHKYCLIQYAEILAKPLFFSILTPALITQVLLFDEDVCVDRGE